MVQRRAALGGIPVRRAVVTEFEHLSRDGRISRVARLILPGPQRDVPVDDRGRSQDPARPVMIRDVAIAEANGMLKKAAAQLQACGCHTMPVQLGPLTLENLGEVRMVRQPVLQARGRGRSASAA